MYASRQFRVHQLEDALGEHGAGPVPPAPNGPFVHGHHACRFLQGQPAVVAMLDRFDPLRLRLPEFGQCFEERHHLRWLPGQRLLQIVDLEVLRADRDLAVTSACPRVIDERPGHGLIQGAKKILPIGPGDVAPVLVGKALAPER